MSPSNKLPAFIAAVERKDGTLYAIIEVFPTCELRDQYIDIFNKIPGGFSAYKCKYNKKKKIVEQLEIWWDKESFYDSELQTIKLALANRTQMRFCLGKNTSIQK